MPASAPHELQFFRGFLANPLAIGAPVPSGRQLAAAIAAQIPAATRGSILELGAGTGAVSEAILARRGAPSALVAVESEPGFAGVLRRRFPQSHILEGDAFDFEALLQSGDIGDRFDAIISGLPVIGRSEAQRAALLQMAVARLKPQAPFIQFSYAFWPPYPARPGIAACRAMTFWRNLPPMHIWTHRAKPIGGR